MLEPMPLRQRTEQVAASSEAEAEAEARTAKQIGYITLESSPPQAMQSWAVLQESTAPKVQRILYIIEFLES